MPLIQQMSNALGLPVSYLRKLERSASYRYKRYNIAKHNGKLRTIYHPAKPLKVVQRWLARSVINQWPIHECVLSYRQDLTIADNASRHVGNRFLLRLDFRSFFESIQSADVQAYLNVVEPSWDAVDRVTFAAFVCRDGCLTIGAPSSPSLTNAICHGLDSQLHLLAESKGVTFTRYSDDLFFSCNEPDLLSTIPSEVRKVLRAQSVPGGLLLNERKTKHSSRKGRRVVTGIVLGSDSRIYVGRRVKRKIRAQIHQYATLNAEQRRSLAGLIAYVQGFDPEFVNSLIKKYGFEAVRVARTHTDA